MSSILFALAGAAFLIVAHWAYANDVRQPGGEDGGLLKMKSAAPTAETEEKSRKKTRATSSPRWKRAPDARRVLRR
jgi:hypothetical protein